MKVDPRSLSQTALSAIHLMRIAASLPTPPQGQGCPRQPLATHALFGISIMSVCWAAVDRARGGLQGKHHLCGCGREGGCKARCPQASDLLALSGKGHLHHLWK